MTLHVIGAGVGRTGTHSLMLALDQLGLGPTHHMEKVIKDPPRHVPRWSAAVEGKPDWQSLYEGYASAVDWPTASFWQELCDVYPDAKVVLTVRDPQIWAESFSETINRVVTNADQAPPEKQPFLAMVRNVLGKAGFAGITGQEDLVRAFNAHTERVKKGVPADRLLVFEVQEGWEPLCRFLGKPVPAGDFPRSNSREEFWARMVKQ